MKEFAIILIAVWMAHSGAAHVHQRHSKICHNQNGIMVAMRGSCSGFYICVQGNAIASSCGDFFYFNARTGHCDHPTRVACYTQPPIEPTPNQIEHPHELYTHLMPMLALTTTPTTVRPTSSPLLDIPRSQHPDEVVADIAAGDICKKKRNGVQLPRIESGDCTQFYVCILQRPYRRTCATPKQFSVAHGMCVVPALAQCFEEQDIEQQEQEETKQQELEEKKRLEQAVEVMKHQQQEQAEEVKNEQQLEEQLQAPVFLPTPSFSMPRPIKQAQYAEYSLTCRGIAPGSLMPHPTDCDKFLSCSSRRRVFEMRCPLGLHFSATEKHCDWPKNAKCAMFE